MGAGTLTVGSLTTGNIALTASRDILGSDPISAPGTVTLQATRNINWNAAGAIDATGNVAFTAGSALTDDGAITSSAGTVQLTATASTLTTAAAIAGHNGVTLTATGADISDTGAVSSSAGPVAFVAATNILINPLVQHQRDGHHPYRSSGLGVDSAADFHCHRRHPDRLGRRFDDRRRDQCSQCRHRSRRRQ